MHGVLNWILIPEIDFIWFAVLLALTHGAIDDLKLRFQKKKTKRIWCLVDQDMQIIVIIFITMVYKNETIDFTGLDNQFWIFSTGLLLLTKPTSILIKNIITIWTPESKKSDDSLSNAGNYIGI